MEGGSPTCERSSAALSSSSESSESVASLDSTCRMNAKTSKGEFERNAQCVIRIFEDFGTWVDASFGIKIYMSQFL